MQGDRDTGSGTMVHVMSTACYCLVTLHLLWFAPGVGFKDGVAAPGEDVVPDGEGDEPLDLLPDQILLQTVEAVDEENEQDALLPVQQAAILETQLQHFPEESCEEKCVCVCVCVTVCV